MGGRRDRAVVIGRLVRFAEQSGWPAEPQVLRNPVVIEAFCAHGMAGSTSASRGTYRSVLRAWAGLADGGRSRRGPGYPGAGAPGPYTRSERAELVAIAAAQPGARRSAARAMTAAGLGAGLTTSELMALRGADVVRVEGDAGLVIAVGGRRRRQVPVTPPHDATLAELASAAGQEHVFRPGLTDRGLRTRSATSPRPWCVIRPRRRSGWVGPGPVSSVTTSPPAPRSHSYWRSLGSSRPGP